VQVTVRTPAPGGVAPGGAAATLSEWLENRSSPGQIKGAARIVTQSWRRHKKPRRQRAFCFVRQIDKTALVHRDVISGISAVTDGDIISGNDARGY